LKANTVDRSVNELTGFDENNNATEVIRDYSKDNSTEARLMRAHYTALNQLEGTTIPDVTVDDSTKPADLITPPTKQIDVTTKRVRDSKGNEVCRLNQSGHWSFDLYDGLGRKTYSLRPEGVDTVKVGNTLFSVIGYDYNPFDEIIQETKFFEKISLDIKPYFQTGIPLDVVYKIMKTKKLESTSRKRVTIYKRDHRGDIKDIFWNTVLHYFPGFSVPKYAQPQTTYTYNAFRDRILIDKLRFSDYTQLNKRKRQWFDRRGELVAEMDAIQSEIVNGSLLETPIEYRVKRYFMNSFGKEEKSIAYANSLQLQSAISDEFSGKDNIPSLLTDMTLTDLDTICSKQTSSKDRIIEKRYDLLHRLIKEIYVGIVRQVITKPATLKSIKDRIYAHVHAQLEKLEETQPGVKSKKAEPSTVESYPVEHHTGTNTLLADFAGNDRRELDQRNFNTWYSSDTCLYLMNLVENKSHSLPYLFNDPENDENDAAFKKQFICLQRLSDHLKRPAIFISKEPGVTDHFIMGCYFNKRVFLMNPLGIPDDVKHKIL